MGFDGIFSRADSRRAYIIAEIGGNFLTYEEAKKLIDAAKGSGVDCIKLQTFRADTLSSRKAMFDMENTGKISQYDFFKKYEISEKLHKKVFDYAEKRKVDWFSTPAHQSDVDMLESLGVKAFKIGADDAVNIPLLKYIARRKLPVFLSTGMCTLKDVRQSVDLIRSEGNDRIVILHTVSLYPTYPQHVNLNAIRTLKDEFPEYPIGYSDHTLSPLACIAAYALGARVIERHFTLDKKSKGPDHVLSSDPAEMKYLVDSIKEIEKMLGTGVKEPGGLEARNIRNNRKSVIAVRDIRKDEAFSENNISIKRPGTGISPEYFDSIIGRKAKRYIKKEELFSMRDVV